MLLFYYIYTVFAEISRCEVLKKRILDNIFTGKHGTYRYGPCRCLNLNLKLL